LCEPVSNRTAFTPGCEHKNSAKVATQSALEAFVDICIRSLVNSIPIEKAILRGRGAPGYVKTGRF
jgi:hypothetical protein